MRLWSRVNSHELTPYSAGNSTLTGGRDVRDPFDNGTNLEARAGKGKDDLAGYGVHSIVLQVPEERVTRDGDRFHVYCLTSDADEDGAPGLA